MQITTHFESHFFLQELTLIKKERIECGKLIHGVWVTFHSFKTPFF